MQVEDEFVEIQDKEKENKPTEPKTSNRPDFRIVQTEVDRDGKTIFKNVGGMWKNTSKNGNEFYTLMIGQLKLLVFPNQNK